MSKIIKELDGRVNDFVKTLGRTLVQTNDGKYHYVDTAMIMYTGYETMAFKCDENGEVLDWDGEYVNRDASISHEYVCTHLEELLGEREKK